METTRQTIVSILRRRQATVDELSKELGLAPATVRRHLDILARDGHVEVTQVRRKTGRPHYVFSLSEAGEDLFPTQNVPLTNRLIEEIIGLTPDETSGRSGVELAELVFARMTRRLADKVAPRVAGATLAERVPSAVAALADEGAVFEVEERDGAFLLIGHACPCPRVGAGQGQVCHHDRRLLATLLGTDVTYAGLPGQDGHNAYLVQAGPAAREGGLSGEAALV
jgi:predicted ArsR family transcriptional regulator